MYKEEDEFAVRQRQFCDMLTKARLLSGAKWWEISSRMKVSETAAKNVVNGKHDSSMKNVFNYIEAVNSVMTVVKGEDETQITSSEGLLKWMKKKMADNGWSQYAFADKLGVTQSVVSSWIKRSNFRLSTFMLIVDVLGYSYSVSPNDLQEAANDRTNDCDIDTPDFTESPGQSLSKVIGRAAEANALDEMA